MAALPSPVIDWTTAGTRPAASPTSQSVVTPSGYAAIPAPGYTSLIGSTSGTKSFGFVS